MFKTLMVGVVAAVGMGFAVQSAQALTVTTTAQTTVATISNLTLRDSLLGNVLSNVTLTLSINAASGAAPLQVGRVTGGVASITSPAGVSARLTFSSTTWPVFVTGLSGSGLSVQIRDLVFALNGTPVGTINYSGGSVSGTIGASPASAFVVTGSGVPSSIGSTGTFAVGSSFALNPTLSYVVTP